MTSDRYRKNSKGTEEKLLSCLNLCHNILRSQEGMSPESAFRELNKLLYVKYISERYEDGDWRYHYEDDYVYRMFDRVKDEFRYEYLFDASETINSKSISYKDVLGTLDGFRFSSATVDAGHAYESFVQKVLRNISDEPIIADVVAEYIVDFMNIKHYSNVVDPFCGYGGMLSEMVARGPRERIGKTFGYEKDSMLAQTAKMNLLMHGSREGRVEREVMNQYYINQQFDNVVACIKHRETIQDDIRKALGMFDSKGMAVLLMADDILQNDQYEDVRREMLFNHKVKAIISLPSSAIRSRGRQTKWSVLFFEAGRPQGEFDETLIARVENIGVSSVGLPSEKNDFKEIEPSVYQWLQHGIRQNSKSVMWVSLPAFEGWNVEAEFLKEENRFVSQYPLYRLGDLVETLGTPVDVLDKDEYKLVTVRKNEHDVVLRETIKTKDVRNTRRQMVVRSGQILISRINAKDGAIGIVPQELDGALVSDNFIAMTIKSNYVEPYYLLMVLTSERYKKLLKGISRGMTARSYIKNADLLELEIPVPDKKKQRELIGNLAIMQEEINSLKEQWKEGVTHFSEELFGQ